MLNTNPVIDEYGTKRWYLNGKLHRTDGPAAEYTSGTKFWFINGLKHRTNGPAIEYPDGYKYWYLYDVEYTEEQCYVLAFVSGMPQTNTFTLGQ